MSVFQTSLLALDKYLENAEQDDLQQILNEVKAMNIEGPTVGDYLSSIVQDKPLQFRFQPGIEACNVEPPNMDFQVIDETPKYPLESFFS